MPPIDVPAAIQSTALFAFSIVVLLTPLIIKTLYPEIPAWLKAHVTVKQWDIVTAIAGDVVAQVEQLKKAGLIPNNDAALKWASKMLHALLLTRGIDLPTDDLVTAIESAVHDLPHSWSQLDAPLPAKTT